MRERGGKYVRERGENRRGKGLGKTRGKRLGKTRGKGLGEKCVKGVGKSAQERNRKRLAELTGGEKTRDKRVRKTSGSERAAAEAKSGNVTSFKKLFEKKKKWENIGRIG